jgi:SAM-dependent methyltransferase
VTLGAPRQAHAPAAARSDADGADASTTVRQDDRAPFDCALRHARASAYAPGEFVGQESFMTAGEIRGLAMRAGVGRGVAVLDLCCGIAGPGRFITRELGCTYLGVDASASAVAIARERAGDLPCQFAVAQIPPLPSGPFDVVLMLETMLAFEDKDALVMPLDELAASLRRAGFVVVWQEDHSRAHRATAQALVDAFAKDAEDIATQIGGRALDEMLAAHRLWIEWLDAGRVRKLALVAQRA